MGVYEWDVLSLDLVLNYSFLDVQICPFFSESLSFQTNVVQRVVHLPLVRSVAQSVTSVYKDVKGRYPFFHLLGVVAELGVRNISQAALQRATPLLESLEPQSKSAQCFLDAWLHTPTFETQISPIHINTDLAITFEWKTLISSRFYCSKKTGSISMVVRVVLAPNLAQFCTMEH